MPSKYSRSGNTDEALTIPATDCRELLGSTINANRHFWLRSVWVYNSHATDATVVQIYDQDETVATAANERLVMRIPALTLQVIDLPAPGIKFYTNITAACTGGTVAVYQAGCMGYEEGGS